MYSGAIGYDSAAKQAINCANKYVGYNKYLKFNPQCKY